MYVFDYISLNSRIQKTTHV